MISCLVVFSLLSLSSLSAGISLTPRIHSADRAFPHQFPYVVSLRLTYGVAKDEHYCAGGILNERWIISAAHCMRYEYRNTSTVAVQVGAHNYIGDGEKYEILKIIVHPDFNGTFSNDISLSQTVLPIIFSQFVQPIPISTEWIGPERVGILTGWGHTEIDFGPVFLKYIELRVIPNDVCIQKHLPQFRDLIQDRILCTFTGYGYGSCNGDSGGVLAIDDKLVGILSWGIPCAIGYPDQFTRISEYLDFIRINTGMEIL